MAMTDSHHRFEFQRLHGMGEEVHEVARKKFGYHCRIYAPVGAREDLLAYLVRRILENGANSSFLNQLVDTDIPVGEVASDPIEKVREPEAFNTKSVGTAAKQHLWRFKNKFQRHRSSGCQCNESAVWRVGAIPKQRMACWSVRFGF